MLRRRSLLGGTACLRCAAAAPSSGGFCLPAALAAASSCEQLLIYRLCHEDVVFALRLNSHVCTAPLWAG